MSITINMITHVANNIPYLMSRMFGEHNIIPVIGISAAATTIKPQANL